VSDSEDPLGAFDDLASCPACATLAQKGTPRCPECGAFHMPIEDAETRVNEQENRPVERVTEEPRDPGFYSIDPRGEIPEEHFEGDEDAIADWDGSSVDFDIGDDE